MHWHHEVFILKGVLKRIHIYTWGHLLILWIWGYPKVVKYSILSKMCDTIKFLLKVYVSANMLHFGVIFLARWVIFDPFWPQFDPLGPSKRLKNCSM